MLLAVRGWLCSFTRQVLKTSQALTPSLFALMTVLAQSFFTFVGRHLVSFFLFSVRHTYLSFRVNYVSYELFFDRSFANGIGEFLGRFEHSHFVSRNQYGCVSHQVASGLRCSALQEERAEISEVDGLAFDKCFFHCIHIGFDNSGYRFSVNTGLLRNRLDDVSFSHVYEFVFLNGCGSLSNS